MVMHMSMRMHMGFWMFLIMLTVVCELPADMVVAMPT